MNNKLQNKLAKLIRLSEDENATEGEVNNALKMAAQLMAKHNLTRDDIDLETGKPSEKVVYSRLKVYSISSKITTWEATLLHFISEFYGTVKHYLQSGDLFRVNGVPQCDSKGNAIFKTSGVFYGVEEDCEGAAELYNELREAIQILAIAKWGGWFRGDGASYAEGFTWGLINKMEEAQEALELTDEATGKMMLQCASNQLALREGAEDWLSKSCGVKLRKSSARSGSAGSLDARSGGIADGKSYGVTKKQGRKKLN